MCTFKLTKGVNADVNDSKLTREYPHIFLTAPRKKD